jgi:hypothetical protein
MLQAVFVLALVGQVKAQLDVVLGLRARVRVVLIVKVVAIPQF